MCDISLLSGLSVFFSSEMNVSCMRSCSTSAEMPHNCDVSNVSASTASRLINVASLQRKF